MQGWTCRFPDDRHRKVLKSALREKFRQYRVA